MRAQALHNGGLDVVDERAITAVLVRYATALDTRDWALFRSCFSEDFQADFGGFGSWSGPREITDHMRDAHLEMGMTLHRITNVTIERIAGEVLARSYVDVVIMPGRSGGSIHRGLGWYQDRMARTSEGWKISRRCFHPVLLE